LKSQWNCNIFIQPFQVLLSFEAFVYINANKMVAYLKVPGMCYCNGTSLEYYIS